MNLTLERAPALSALSRLKGVVPSGSKIPMLLNVALKAEGSRLLVRATDLDMEAVEAIRADVRADGETTLPADKFYDIIRNADEGAEVGITLDDADPRAKVKSGRSTFRVPTLPAGDFPVFAADNLKPALLLPAKTLTDMLARTLPFVDRSTDHAKLMYHISCVHLETRAGQLRAVAASNSGIALRREDRPEGGEVKVTLPPKLVSRLLAWLDESEDVAVETSASLVRFTQGARQLTSKLYDATDWVAYENHLIEDHEVYARTDRDALMAALRRILILSDGKTVYLTLRDNEICVHGRGYEFSGEAADELPCEYDGPEAQLKLSPNHSLNLLSQMRGDIVEMGFATVMDEAAVKTGKVILRAPCDPGFTAITMQMRV